MSAAAASPRRAGRASRSDRLPRLARWTGEMAASGRLPAFLVALTTGLLAFAFLFTVDYPVSAITVEGLTVGEAREVVETSGLLGDPVFRAELEEAAERVAALPYVEHVEVSLTIPGEATIQITEREPALIVARGSERLLVATSGAVMASSTDLDGLPVLKVSQDAPLDDSAMPQDLVDAVALIAAERGSDVELRWTRDDGLILSLPSGRAAIFGEPERPAAKLAVLEAVEDQIDADWRILDLREPTRPAYR